MDFTAFSSKDLTTTVMKGVGPGAAVDSSSSQAFNQSCFFFFFFLKYLIVGSALVVWSHPTGAMRCGSVVAVAGHGMRHEQVCSCSALRRSPAEPFPAHHPDVFRGQPCFSLPSKHSVFCQRAVRKRQEPSSWDVLGFVWVCAIVSHVESQLHESRVPPL